MQEAQHPVEEIELIDLLRVIWKRKKLIIFGAVLITLAAAVTVFLLPRVYEVTAIIEPGRRPITDQNGQIVEEKVVVSAVSIKETILGGAFDETVRTKLKIPESKFPDIKVEVPQNTDLVKIAIESHNPEAAVNILRNIVVLVSQGLQEKINLEKNQVRNEIRLAQIEFQTASENLKVIQQQVDETRGSIVSLENEKKRAIASRRNDAMSVLLYSNEMQNQQIYLSDLLNDLSELQTQARKAEAKLENLQQKLDKIKATTIYKSPTIPGKAVKPKKALIIALAFVLGIMISMMTAFAIEYAESARAKANATNLGDSGLVGEIPPA